MHRTTNKQTNQKQITENTISSLPITPEEQLFINQYVQTTNKKTALVNAGIVPKNCTLHQAEKIADGYLRNINVQMALVQAVNDRVKRLQATEDRVIAQLHRMAFLDTGQLEDSKGRPIPLKQLPLHVRQCITAVEYKSIWGGKNKKKIIGKITKYKVINQLDALKLLLEKVILKSNTINLNQINNFNIEDNHTEQSINVKELTEEQVKALLKLKGCVSTPLGYKQETEQKQAEVA